MTIAILTEEVSEAASPAMHLIWITDSKESRYQDNLCRSWQDAFDNFFYVPVDNDGSDAGLSTASILEHLDIKPDDLPNYDFYVAGNKALLNTCQQILPPDRLKTTPLGT